MQKRFPNIAILLMAVLCAYETVHAQSSPAKTDSSAMYRDIESYSKKRKSTFFIYGIFFKPVNSTKAAKKQLKKRKMPSTSFVAAQGKIIRDIFISTLDPFGYSVTDTGAVPQNAFFRAGNNVHVKTQRLAILNLILLKKNQPFDSLLAKESERLIRSQKFVHEVALYALTTGRHSDSVDVYIRELDSWSLIPHGSFSPSGFSIGLTDRNFLGMGHEFENDFSTNYTTGIQAFNTNYYIPNIRNTYINTRLHYQIDSNGNLTRNLVVDRPFFSPLAKWAAGIALASQSINDSTINPDLTYNPLHLKFGTEDYWAGDAQRVFKGNTVEDRVTNAIFTARYLRVRYSEKPPESIDTLHQYADEDFYLAGIGISSRIYFKDQYVLNFGVTEDVPVGKAFGLTFGYQVKDDYERTYAGVRFSFGNYNDWGYLGSNLEYGTFFRASHAEQGVFTGELNYFTDLFEIGNWKIRQFIKPQLTLGIHRFSYENITINNEHGIRGFNSQSAPGTRKLILTLQTQSYSPWNILGFHFGPYLICSFGMLGDDTFGFQKSKIYSQLGIGVLIKNEYLVINHFQISISFYPVIPGGGNNIFKLNSNVTTDFVFPDFILGKPSTVAYQ